jgi:hypothetical protein
MACPDVDGSFAFAVRPLVGGPVEFVRVVRETRLEPIDPCATWRSRMIEQLDTRPAPRDESELESFVVELADTLGVDPAEVLNPATGMLTHWAPLVSRVAGLVTRLEQPGAPEVARA